MADNFTERENFILGNSVNIKWFLKAIDKNNPLHPEEGAAHTESYELDGQNILVPRVRIKDGKAVLNADNALDEALEKGDYIVVPQGEDPDQYSKDLSKLIGKFRGFNKGGLVENQTVDSELLPAKPKPRNRSDVLRNLNNPPRKGLSYGELLVDNILGLDNEYESFGEKLGKAINEDEISFLKDAAVGIYEGAKEFVTSPVETTKEVIRGVKTSVSRLASDDLEDRLRNMYDVDYEEATDEQVNAAREAVFGDVLTAMELIPAAKVTVSAAKAGSAAIPSGVKADVVGQTKALLSGDTEFLKGTPTERSGTVGVGAEVVGQDNVSLDDITDYMGSEIQPTKSKKETNPLVQEIDYNNYNTSGDLFNFRSSVLGSLDNLAIGKDGMSGFQIKKFLEKRAPKINKTELYWSGLLENLDDNKKYSRLELENIADRNVPKVDIQVLDGSQVRYRDMQRVNLNVNNYVMQPLDGYKEIIIVNKNTKGTEYSAGHYDIMFQPDGNVLAHVRGSFVKNNEPDFPIKEKFFLVEELQSDAVQQHTVADKAIAKKIKAQETSKPTLGDIGLHYQTEFNDMIFPYHAGGLEFTDKFVKDINRYNYNFRSIGDQETAEQAINLGLTKIIDDMAKLKSGFVDGNRNKDAIAFLLSREYGLKENSIKRRSIEELDEVDNIFANVLADYVFGKTAIRKFNKENNNEFKDDLINIFKGINITAGLEKDLVPAKLSDTIRMSLLAVIRESKSEGVNKIYIPTPKVISKAHDLSLEAAKNTYSDGVRKVLRTLNSETNGKIKFKNKNPEDISYSEDKDSVGIEIDITDFDLPDNPQFRFAEGGVVEDMDNQMNMAFMEEGGLQDDGMDQDPVSGNEVPSGSMAKEVRDDVPAQLSEGEYVVPADVVRFYGVKFFEDLRMEAKKGLQDMEANGRIGGEPVDSPMARPDMPQEMSEDLSSEELEFLQSIAASSQDLDNLGQDMSTNVRQLNEGGSVRGYYTAGDVKTSVPSFLRDYATPGALQLKMSTEPSNDTGDTPEDKEPEDGCPEGMMWNGSMCVIDPNYAATTPSSRDDDDDDDPVQTSAPWYEGEDLSDINAFLDKTLAEEEQPTSVIGGLLSNMPIMKAVGSIGKLSSIAKARAAVEIAKSSGGQYTESQIEDMEERIDDYISDNKINPNLANTIASGALNTSAFMGAADKNKDGVITPEEMSGATGVATPTSTGVQTPTDTKAPVTSTGRDITGGGLGEAKKIKKTQGDDGPSAAQIAAARAQTPTAKAATGTKTTEEARSSAASAAEKLGTGLATGGRATGGLVSRTKKK